jgi:AcrR family transcriptional regulator
LRNTETSEGLTAGIEKAWRGAGARSGLTTDAILDAAIEIGDREGLASVTFRKLGEAVGSSPMALYRHVDSRDELLLLAFDSALGEPPAYRSTADWRSTLEEWAMGLYRRYVAHPVLVEIPIRGLPSTPHHAGWIERLLVVSKPSGLEFSQRLGVGLLLDGHVRNIAALGHTLAADAVAERHRARAILAVAAADLFPELRAVLAAGAMQNGKPPAVEFGIRVILNGIQSDTANPRGSAKK